MGALFNQIAVAQRFPRAAIATEDPRLLAFLAKIVISLLTFPPPWRLFISVDIAQNYNYRRQT